MHDGRASKPTTSSSIWRLRRKPTAARCHSRERRGRATELDNAKAPPGGREEHARPPLLVPGRRLASAPRDAVEDVVDLLIGAPGGMVGGEVLQERLGALALRRRKVLGESGFVHPSEEVEEAAAELSVELIGHGPLLLRRRCLLRVAAVRRRVIPQSAALV